MVHWMRDRHPRFKNSFQGELERPSPSYIVDVSVSRVPNRKKFMLTYLDTRCSRRWQE